jgi:hypothetical protein
MLVASQATFGAYAPMGTKISFLWPLRHTVVDAHGMPVKLGPAR